MGFPAGARGFGRMRNSKGGKNTTAGRWVFFDDRRDSNPTGAEGGASRRRWKGGERVGSHGGTGRTEHDWGNQCEMRRRSGLGDHILRGLAASREFDRFFLPARKGIEFF
jgi:hypothetical protein